MLPADENQKTLPKMASLLPGVLSLQYRRCGKPNCGCAQGRLHGPYFYRYWRANGKLYKEYVPREAVATIQEQCAAYRRHQQHLKLRRRELRAAHAEWRRMGQLLREIEEEE